jgi:hypothetical protein
MVDSVQLENSMIYLHGEFDSATNRALFYKTKWWDDYFKFIVLEPSHEIGEELREKLKEHQLNFLKNNGFIFDKEFNLVDEPGYHIIPSNIMGLQNRIKEALVKHPKNKYYIFDTANLEPFNIFDNIDYIRDKPNCIFYTTHRITEANKLFDFGFVLRKFIANRIVLQHYECYDIFKSFSKKYRLDLSIRNFPQKDERVELLRVLQNHQKENINLRVNDYYVNRIEQLKEFATLHNNLDKLDQYKIEFKMVDRLNQSLVHTTPLIAGQQEHIGAMKLIDVTLSSDIQIMFESNQNSLYKTNNKLWCNITEKTIDNLLIGKPFIICSKVALDFLNQFGFETYADELGIDYDELFSNYDFIIQKLAKHTIRISEMDEIEYKDMLNKLETKTKINRDKCLEIIEKNTILDNIIDDYTLNFI